MPKTLRSYQDEALTASFKWLFENKGNPLTVVPVGGGKSLLIAEAIKRLHGWYPNTKILLLSHIKELLQQNAAELLEQYPNCDLGFYCAGLNQKKLYNDVTFASIQSIGKKANLLPRSPAIIIVDECHLIPHKTSTLYRKFISDCMKLNPNLRVWGFTGTSYRSDTGRLDEGKDKLFDYIAYEIPMTYMIEEGWWAKPVAPKTDYQMDVSGVSVRGGDYVIGELEDKINTAEINDICVRELLELGKDRKKWLVFTAGVKHAHDVAAEIKKSGITVDVVTGETPPLERNAIITAFRKGEIRCLVNVAVLTVGFNVPDIDLLCLMRPMRSPVLYVQTIGRGVRPVYAQGYDLSTTQGRLDAIYNSTKPDCMIVDFGGVVSTLGAVDQIDIRKKYDGEKETEGDGQAITKICPNCGTVCATAQRYCYNCSHCFIELESMAGRQAVVSIDIEPEWYPVHQVANLAHFKKGGLPSMNVRYYTISGVMSEYICFEHHQYEQGDNKRYAWNKAVQWHKARLPDTPCPQSVTDALNLPYPEPSHILAKKEGKYWRVMDYRWDNVQKVEEPKYEEYFDIPF